MYRILSGGLGNVLIHLSTITDPTIPVYIKNKTQFLTFSNLNIVEEDDPELETIKLHGIYLNNNTAKYDHQLIRARITPVQNLIKDEHLKLLFDVQLGISIRTFYETDDLKPVPIEQFYKIIENFPENSNIFLTSDTFEVKRNFKEKYGERIKYIEDCAHSLIDFKNPTPYIEFFLLSMCPFIAFTAGGIIDKSFNGFSTFGYMAGIYGKRELIGIDHNDFINIPL